LTPTPVASGLSSLSLVYVDARSGTPQLFVSKSDGSSPRKVLDLQRGTRVLDVRDTVALVAGVREVAANPPTSDPLLLVDLRDGKTVDLKPNGAVRDGRFLDADTIVFATAGSGCGPQQMKPTLQSYSVKDGAKKELYAGGYTSITIAGIGKDGTVVFSPRGCDIGLSQVVSVNAKAGGAPKELEVRGCGWTAASFELMDVVVGGCGEKDGTLYGLPPNTHPPRDFKAPGGQANLYAPWVLRPGGREIAFSMIQTTGTGPGSTRGGGISVVDLSSGQFRDLAPPAGSEQSAVAWTPDGRYLLASAVQAQGLCSFSIIDTQDKKVTPLPDAISFCGTNGAVWGFTTIR
jgi:hypothetical protein